MKDSEIVRVNASTELAKSSGPSVLEMMQQVVNRDNPQDMAGALEQLVKLKEHIEDRDAKAQFFEAFARVKPKLKPIIATQIVPDKTGATKWKVAPFQDMMDAVEPILQSEGLSVRFDANRDGNILVGICYAMHTGGHSESAKGFVSAGSAQGGDVGAMTTAKRVALMNMFGLTVRRDDDARLLGDFIDPDELTELQRLVSEAGAVDMPKFLKFAGATKMEDIRKGKLPQLRMFLQKKIASRKAAESGQPTPIKRDAQGNEIPLE